MAPSTAPFDPFDYHTPSPHQRETIETFRATAKSFRALLEQALPPSRERSLAVTKLEEALMWANKAAVTLQVASEEGTTRGDVIGQLERGDAQLDRKVPT